MIATERTTRKGLSLLQLAQRFSCEDEARRWFKGLIWPNSERDCPNCGSLDTHEASHPKMPYRCRDCRKYLSVKTGTVMAGSPLPLRKWASAIYLDATSVKGASSMRPSATTRPRTTRNSTVPRDAHPGLSDRRPAPSLAPLGGVNRTHFRHHQPQKPTVRESGAGPQDTGIWTRTTVQDASSIGWVA